MAEPDEAYWLRPNRTTAERRRAELETNAEAEPTPAAAERSEPGWTWRSGALRGAVQALLFVADAPIELTQLAAAVQRPASRWPRRWPRSPPSWTSRRPAGSSGRRRRVPALHPGQLAPVVEAYLLEGQRSKLSQAALETLAVIAYRQPVTRARISAIRGVNVDGVVRTLLARELITEAGTDPVTGGGLYRTTDTFLEKMGIESVDELPSLAPLLPELDTLDDEEL